MFLLNILDDWHQYDCTMLPEVKQGAVSGFVSWFTGDEKTKDRLLGDFITGATNMLPPWGGICNEKWRTQELGENVLAEMDNVEVAVKKLLKLDYIKDVLPMVNSYLLNY